MPDSFPKPTFQLDYAIATEIQRLREHRATRGIPNPEPKNLLVATWNIDSDPVASAVTSDSLGTPFSLGLSCRVRQSSFLCSYVLMQQKSASSVVQLRTFLFGSVLRSWHTAGTQEWHEAIARPSPGGEEVPAEVLDA